jgi:sugar phosphate isomerase/epimerase
MQAGISSYTYTWAIGVPGNEPIRPMTIYQLLDKAVQHNVPVVQVADNLPLYVYSKDEQDNILQYARKNHVKVEVGTKRLDEENLERYLDIAGRFHSPFLRIVIDDANYAPAINEVIAIIKNALPAFQQKNIKLAIENHDRFTSREFVKIIEKSSPGWTGICLDSVNSMGAGEGLDTVIHHLAPLAINLHVKEFTVKRAYHKMGFLVEGLPLGQGMLPMKRLLQEIGPACTSAILEQWTPPEAKICDTVNKERQWAEESIKHLKNWLNQ